MSRIHQSGQKPATAPEINKQSLDEHSLIDRILCTRGVASHAELQFSLKDLPKPQSLAGMDRAVALLLDCLQQQKHMMIIGDYDADGATSTALAISALQQLGAVQVSYLVPNRFKFGYGLSEEIVVLAHQQSPDLIITVDNGIASVDGVNKAHELGIKVLITDHHLPPQQLPLADAIVNPNLSDDLSGCGNLAGVGVIFYVMLALRKELQAVGWFGQDEKSAPMLVDLLDLVALGTIADVVKLDRINRILVEQGLRRIRADKTREGIRALLQISGKSQARVCTTDIGFALGPRLNAAGRLSDMSLGVECLLAEDTALALAWAQKLDQLNKERRSIENEMRQEADLLLTEQDNCPQKATPSALCLFEPHWHQGVIGILASRIKDQIHRPVIVFASDDKGELKGSGRSIPGVHLRDALDSVASSHKGLIEKFGGHAMAAGLSLSEDRFDEFHSAFRNEVQKRLEGVSLQKQWLTDGQLPSELISLHWAKTLRYLAPWGQGFPEPLFEGKFTVIHARVVGEKHLKLKLQPLDNDRNVDAIAFNYCPSPLPSGEMNIIYRLDINEYKGECNPQLLIDCVTA